MSRRYYRPTIVFSPEKEELIADRARSLKVDAQDFMRSAILAALNDSNILNKHAETVTIPAADLVISLNELARKLSAAKAELDGIIARSTGGHDVRFDTILSEVSGQTRAGSALVDAVDRSTRNANKPKAGRG